MPSDTSRLPRRAPSRDSSRRGSHATWRSGCPLNASVEILGDRWSLLIIRDMMLRGFSSYKEFLDSYEEYRHEYSADRLRKLEKHGIITTQRTVQMAGR